MTNSSYRWVIVAAGGLMGCVAIGAMFSLPVFLPPISQDTGWSITGISSAMTFGFLAMALREHRLGHAFGSLRAAPDGAAGIGHPWPRALALASRATSLIEFQLVFGLLVGGATAAIFRADDGVRDGLVRHASQPRGVARLRRHGHGADDHVAVGGAACLPLRLENIAPNHRRARRGRHDSGGVAGAPPAGAGSRKRRRFGR